LRGQPHKQICCENPPFAPCLLPLLARFCLATVQPDGWTQGTAAPDHSDQCTNKSRFAHSLPNAARTLLRKDSSERLERLQPQICRVRTGLPERPNHR